MQLFYNPEINESTTQFSFQKEESKHIVKVLRKSSGDIMHITNGRGWMFSAKIIIPSINKCTAKIISKEFQSKHSYNLHLAVAPTKMNDRYEWFLEKATEIGVQFNYFITQADAFGPKWGLRFNITPSLKRPW